MDVNRIGSTGYQAPPPAPGSGESPAAPPVQASAVEVAAPEIRLPEMQLPERQGRDEGELLRSAVRDINNTIATHRRHLDVRMHEPTGRRVVTVYNSDTNEAIREIPPERVLDAHASLLEIAGLFVDARG